MASPPHSLLTQREPDSPGRNSIFGRSFHHCAEHDQKSRAARSASACQRNLFRESLFQHSYPTSELKIVRSADEKVHVIGHDHVAADGDIANQVRLLGEPDECRVHRIGREQFPPLVCAKRDEEQGIAERRSIASAAEVLDIRARESCSRFPVGSAMRM